MTMTACEVLGLTLIIILALGLMALVALVAMIWTALKL